MAERMERDWRRIGFTWLGLGHLSIGAAVVTIAIAGADRTIWSRPRILLGGVLCAQGFLCLYVARNTRPLVPLANGHARVGIPFAPEELDDPELAMEGLLVPHANGHARVGIALAPAERDDPELAVEGLLLHNDLQRIRVPPINVDVVAHGPPVAANGRGRVDNQLAPVEQGHQELAMVGLVINDPPQALNRRDGVGVEQAEANDARMEQGAVGNGAVRVDIPLAPAERNDPELAVEEVFLHHDQPRIREPPRNADVVVQGPLLILNGRVVVGVRLDPAKQCDPELPMAGLVRNDPPRAVTRRDGADVEETEDNDAMMEQGAVGNGSFRVDIPLAPAERNDPELAIEEIISLQQPPIAFDRRDEDVVEKGACNDVGQVQAAAANAVDRAGICLRPAELGDEDLLLSEHNSQMYDPTLDLKEGDVDSLPKSEHKQLPLIKEKKEQLVEDVQFFAERGTEEVSPLVCVGLEVTDLVGLQSNAPCYDGNKVEQFYHRAISWIGGARIMDGLVQAEPLDEPVHAEPLDEPVHAGRLDEPVHAGRLDEPVHAGRLDEPVQAGRLDEPVQAGRLDEPVQAGRLDEPVQAGRLDEPVQAGPLGEPVQAIPLADDKKSASIDEIGPARSANDERQVLESEALNASLDKY